MKDNIKIDKSSHQQCKSCQQFQNSWGMSYFIIDNRLRLKIKLFSIKKSNKTKKLLKFRKKFKKIILLKK